MKAYVECPDEFGVALPWVEIETPKLTVTLKGKYRARVEGIPLGTTDSLALLANVERLKEESARRRTEWKERMNNG